MTTDPGCRFGKALLARFCECDRSRRHAIAEGESVSCTEPAAAQRCAALGDALRAASVFVLRAHPGAALPHAAELRLQWGGLQGLAQALGNPDASAVNVHALVALGEARFGAISALPYEQIVRAIAACRPRRRA